MTLKHEIPRHWTWKTLAEVGSWSSGGTPRSGTSEYYDGPHPWAVIGDLNDGRVAATERTITQAGLDNSSAKLVPAGTLLVAMYGSIGKLGIASTELATNQAIACCQPDAGVEVKWLLYWLMACRYDLQAAGKGGTQQNISQSVLKPWPVPVPPVEEQRAIVETVERLASRLRPVDSMIEAAQGRLLRTEKAMIRRALDHASSDPDSRIVRWGEVGTTISGRAFPSAAYQDHGIPLVRAGNLAPDGRVVWSATATQYLPEEFGREHPKYLLHGRALLMNLTAQSLADDFLGRVCLTSDDDRFLLNQRIAALSADGVSAEYLYWVFRSPAFRNFIGRANTGSLIQHISTKALPDFPFPLPSPDRQSAVVEELTKFTSVTRHADRAMEQIRPRIATLRRSILKAAFEGRLSRGAQGVQSLDDIQEAIA